MSGIVICNKATFTKYIHIWWGTINQKVTPEKEIKSYTTMKRGSKSQLHDKLCGLAFTFVYKTSV